MKKLVIILAMVGTYLQAEAPLQENALPTTQLTEKQKSFEWQRVLRPPFRTIAVMSEFTALASGVAALICGADVLVGNDKFAKDRLVTAGVCLFLSCALNVFSHAALEELSSNQ